MSSTPPDGQPPGLWSGPWAGARPSGTDGSGGRGSGPGRGSSVPSTRRRAALWVGLLLLLLTAVGTALLVQGGNDPDGPAAVVVESDPPETADAGGEPEPEEPAEEPEPEPEVTSAPEEPAAVGPEEAETGSALAAVAQLVVAGRAPMTGYDRAEFGQRWADVDRNGCDQRNDVLARDLTDLTFRPGTNGCVVETGTLHDPFSGETIAFRRGQDTSAEVQIDHVVALADAWQKGAQQWDAGKRQAFGNDDLNLLAVDGPLNQQKGAGDTATWLPPNRSFRCAYVARQVAVKVEYDVRVTQAEHDAMVQVLSTCPDEPLPTRAGAPPALGAPPASTPTPRSGTSGSASTGSDGVSDGCRVKGNHSRSGEWIYHVPGGQSYEVTNPEECFDTEAEAEAAGYRKAKR